ncbi:patatin-like phospholipase family protein [Uliginosibacterium sp. H3]|uniref:Patatin-like phospholipase family protein n=1 Tax=Uliginosibacterium silvisoli TaxID=3114758 RepID=A0ABU6JZU7_9RHOO|nr:patatin-like phospholipase family protein [Uliginosibacterium sp. H3]
MDWSCRIACSLLTGLCALPVCAQDSAKKIEPAPGPRIGVVLGGGGARGLAHLAVLRQLEELRIPISCIAGTSAGALVGGIYATGRPLAEITDRVRNADWSQILNGSPQRQSLPYSLKINDYKNLADVTFGLDKDGLHLPRRAIGSQNIERFLRELTQDAYATSFNDLAIPFKAVSTNLITGDAKVFESGDLSLALRASMAVPGVFDLVEFDGDYLVDGMFVRNLPIEDLKGHCADVVIAVDVGTPTLKASDIHSLLDVVTQSMNVTTNRNVIEQRKLLGQRDILIQPDLTGFTAGSFGQAPAIIDRASKLDDSTLTRLRELSVDEASYARWHARLNERYLANLRTDYDRIEVAKTKIVPQEIVQQALGGDNLPKTQKGLMERLDELFKTGEFDQVNYFLRDSGGQRIATITPIEREVGPDYLRLGTELRFDTHRTADISFLGNYQMTWLNRWGAQWRNDIQLGLNNSLSTEFFQPIARSAFFIAPNASARSDSIPIYDQDGKHIWDVNYTSSMSAIDLGLSLGRFGEARIGPYTRYTVAEIETGSGAGTRVNGRDYGLQTSLTIDQLDNPRFPRRGYLANLSYRIGSATSAQDGRANSRELTLNGDAAFTLDNTTTRLSLRHSASDGTGPDYTQLGGFLQLSGLRNNQLIGNKSDFMRIMGYRQVAPLTTGLGSGTYLGASLETGRMYNQTLTGTSTPWIPSASVWLGIDTFMGPLYTGLGWSNFNGGQFAGYIYLGFIK